VSKRREKIGRNEPCPCGSGRKYKKCCLLREEARPMEIPNPPDAPAPPVTLDVNAVTFPGEAAAVTMVPFFAPGDPRNTHEPTGMPGKYQVTIVLRRPGRFEVAEKAINFSDRLVGDSHIAITPPAVPPTAPLNIGIRIRVQTDAGAFVFDGKPNANGYLGKLISEPLDAQNFDDSIKRAYHAVAPSLSNWSAHLDVPLDVAQVDATELRTGAARALVIMPRWRLGLRLKANRNSDPSSYTTRDFIEKP
jgi:SEC-C motif